MTSTATNRHWDNNLLQNATNSSLRYNNQSAQPYTSVGRTAPILPPRPDGLYRPAMSSYSLPYSSYSGGNYNAYGGFGGMNSYGLPYSNSMYNSYGNLGMYGGHYGGFTNLNDDAERRFIQYAEESSRKTFANVENIVRAFGSIAMMLDSTFFAMTSSFRAVLSVAENFGRLRSTFGQIWYSVSIFRLLNWIYRKVMTLFGFKIPSPSSVAWNQAKSGGNEFPNLSTTVSTLNSGSSWPTVAFLGALISAPYVISKFLPKYEDKSDMSSWKSPGIPAKAAFDFVGTHPSEMSVSINDDVILAPTYIQESMKLKNSGWVFAISNGKNGLVPLNYLVFNKTKRSPVPVLKSTTSENNNSEQENAGSTVKNHTKRVSFGENQIFENIDLDDVIKKAENEAKQYKNSSEK